uniref:MARVEL domain-containing protein n=1 Tax=Steinernema glaseri TaxID=37863 RepID=A0A1I7ZWL5_9BILA
MIARNSSFRMDFDPDHPKWQCCCCNLSSGLKILGSIEAFFSLVVVLIAGYNILQLVRDQTDIVNIEFFMYLFLSLLAIFYGVSSAVLVAGIHLTQKQLMYPTLVARALVVVFVQVFGASVVVKPREEPDSGSPEEAPGYRMGDAPITLRLILLVFLMICISLGILYTIYLVVRCMRYVNSFRKLLDRRNSLIAAGQIGKPVASP